MEFAERGEAIFIYDEKNVSSEMSEQDLSMIKSIFNGKKMYNDSPSCGFSDNVAIIVNDSQTFCFACDTCSVVY